jgi:hypothetical protein
MRVRFRAIQSCNYRGFLVFLQGAVFGQPGGPKGGWRLEVVAAKVIIPSPCVLSWENEGLNLLMRGFCGKI